MSVPWHRTRSRSIAYQDLQKTVERDKTLVYRHDPETKQVFAVKDLSVIKCEGPFGCVSWH
jgi:ssDNA-specific exonuclease RecJ